MPPGVGESVINDNLSFLHDLHVFAPEFTAFMLRYTTDLREVMQPSSDDTMTLCTLARELCCGVMFYASPCACASCCVGVCAVHIEMLQRLMVYLHKVLARTADVAAYGKLCGAVVLLLKANPQLAAVLLDLCTTREEMYKDMLFRNYTQPVREGFVNLLLDAIKVLMPLEGDLLLAVKVRTPGAVLYLRRWRCSRRALRF